MLPSLTAPLALFAFLATPAPAPTPTPAPAPATGPEPAVAVAAAFREVEPGLEAAVFEAPRPNPIGDGKIYVVRIDPTRRRLRLIAARTQPTAALHDAATWAKLHRLPAVINAGMFAASDGKSPVGFAKVDDYKVLVADWNKGRNHQAVLVFDPKEKGLPPVRILDTLCEDPKAVVGKYRFALQSIRMIDCRGKSHWDQDKRKWSAAFVALDGKGRVLFVHVRSPWTPRQLIDMLLGMPQLDLKQAIYMEGGPEASLMLRAGGTSWTRWGSYETGFFESDANAHLWNLPNVIGVEPLP